MNKTVAIGVITANRIDYLKTALDSAYSQGELVNQIIVVDDGSSDGTKQFLADIKDPRVTVVSFESNQGRPAARNAVVEKLSSDVLIWLDDDDALAPGAVESQLKCLAENPQAGIIYVNHVACDDQLNPLESSQPSKKVEPEQMLMQLVFENIVPNGGTLITKETFEKIGSYDLNFLRAQDYHFWTRAALADCLFVHNNNPLYRFRRHQNNLANPEVIEDQSKYHCRILKEVLEKAPIEKIFPILEWSSKPEESAAQAMLIVSRVFFDHGDDDSALDCVNHSIEFSDSRRGQFLKAYILRALDRSKEAAEIFAKALAELEPDFEGLLVDPGAPRGSALIAARARAKREGQKT